jgi:hypothetical protein
MLGQTYLAEELNPSLPELVELLKIRIALKRLEKKCKKSGPIVGHNIKKK